jgi:hypothetical protein
MFRYVLYQLDGAGVPPSPERAWESVGPYVPLANPGEKVAVVNVYNDGGIILKGLETVTIPAPSVFEKIPYVFMTWMFEAVSALTEKTVWRAFDAKTFPWTWSVAPRPELVPTPTGPPRE